MRKIDMEYLKLYCGKEVKIKYISGNVEKEIRGVLEKVIPFVSICIDRTIIPFVSWTFAIQTIFSGKKEKEIIYHNPHISIPYTPSRAKVREILIQSFGKEVGEKIWQQKKELENLFK